eukprot:s44_g35.t1
MWVPPWPLPSSDWLQAALQIAQHNTTAAVTQDHLIFAKKCKYARQADRKYQGSAHAFSAIRQPPALPITEVFLPHQEECILLWDADACEVQCMSEAPDAFNALAPVHIENEVAWIVAKDELSFTARFHALPPTTPEQACVKQEQYVVEPSQVFDQLNNYWMPLWQRSHNQSASDPWPEFDALVAKLPPPPRQFLFDNSLPAWKKAVAKLRAKSARGFDAVSAQELKICPDALIQSLAHVCNQYPAGFPQWMMCARVCPLSKTSEVPRPEQSRPICILSQLYRLFSAVWCSQVLHYWNSWFPPQVCGMLPSRGSHDAAYLAQSELEMAHYLQQPLAGVTLDIIKCFNCIRHACAPKLLIALGLDPARVWQWFASISKLQRYWEVNGQCFGPVTSTCGFPEGDSHSVLVMLSVALLWISNLQSATDSRVSAACYADNWTWATRHQNLQGTAAATTLTVTKACGLDLDLHKTWLWATDTDTANLAQDELSAHFPDQRLQRLHSAKDLGFQLFYSGSRILGSRRSRFEAGLKRLERLTMMPHDLAPKEHLVLTSVFPTAFYGAETFPYSDEMLVKMRTAIADALVGKCTSLSPAMLLLLTGNAILDPEFYTIAQAIRTAMQWLPSQPLAVQGQFFAAAASFTGSNRNTKGPASTLKHLLSKLSWTLDQQGFVHVDGFLRFNLLRDGFPRIRHFLTLAWQNKLVLTHTARHSLYSLPDISRTDTVAILKPFPETQRKQLLREIAGAYQLETQKTHWAPDATGLCRFCQTEDSKEHRLLQCPAFAEAREPFQATLDQVAEHGLEFSMCPCITAHPESQFHQLLHFQQPKPVIHPDFQAFATQRYLANNPFHIYVDGSCQYPHSPTTRIAAFAGIVDVATSDAQRKDLANRFLANGTMPETLLPMFAARVYGEQNINRAELSAIVTASTVPYGFIHSDSQYAINKVQSVANRTLKMFAMANADLLYDLQDANLNPDRLRKIKAHQDLQKCSCLLELYHLLGNESADAAAKTACVSLDSAWFADLVKMHKQIQLERDLLAEVCELHVALATSRAKMEDQIHRQESEAIPVPAKNDVSPILPAIQSWCPSELQTLTFSDNTDWFKWFSWGNILAEQMLNWMRGMSWPSQPQGPFEQELGISWLELGVSFSMFLRKALPILRTNSDRQVRLLMVEDENDITNFAITFQDVAGTFQKMWAQPGDSEVDALSFSEGGDKLALGGQEKVVKIYDVGQIKSSKGRDMSPELVLGNSAATRGEKPGMHSLKIMSLRSVPMQPNIYLSGSMDRSVLIWDTRNGPSPVGWLSGVDISGDSLDISRDGHTLLVGSHRSLNPLQLFDLRMIKEADEESKQAGLSGQAFQSYQWSGDDNSEVQSNPSCMVFQAAWDSFDSTTICAAGEKNNQARIFERPKAGGPLRWQDHQLGGRGGSRLLLLHHEFGREERRLWQFGWLRDHLPCAYHVGANEGRPSTSKRSALSSKFHTESLSRRNKSR